MVNLLIFGSACFQNDQYKVSFESGAGIDYSGIDTDASQSAITLVSSFTISYLSPYTTNAHLLPVNNVLFGD